MASHWGFGTAAAGSTHLTLYLDGTVGTVTDLFRSVDAGSTWVRINDATQQFGGSILDVTADMRTFGTVYVSTNGRGIIWGTSAN
jgi:xyloglucan-specific exo-beta-1,4-glucanase